MLVVLCLYYACCCHVLLLYEQQDVVVGHCGISPAPPPLWLDSQGKSNSDEG